MSLLHEIKHKLILEGIDEDNNWDIYLDYSPAQEEQISLFQTGGLEPEPSYPLDRPGLQVRVKSTRYRTRRAKTKLREIKDALHGTSGWRYYPNPIGSWTLGEPTAVHYGMIQAESDIINMGLTESEGVEFSLNFRLMREEL